MQQRRTGRCIRESDVGLVGDSYETSRTTVSVLGRLCAIRTDAADGWVGESRLTAECTSSLFVYVPMPWAMAASPPTSGPSTVAPRPLIDASAGDTDRHAEPDHGIETASRTDSRAEPHVDLDWDGWTSLQMPDPSALSAGVDGGTSVSGSGTALSAASRSVRPASVRRGWTVVRTVVLLCADLLAALAATSLARGVRVDVLPRTVAAVDTSVTLTYAQTGLVLVGVWVAVLGFVGAYHRRRFSNLWGQSAAVLRASVGVLAIVGVTSLFLRLQLSRTYVLSALSLMVVLTLLARLGVYGAFRLLMRAGMLANRVLLVGPPAKTGEIQRHLERTSTVGVRVVASMTADGVTADDIVSVATKRGLTSVILCGQSELPQTVIGRLSTALTEISVALVVVPGTAEALGTSMEFHPIGDLVLLRVTNADPRPVERLAKAVIDRVGAAVLLVFGAPALLAIAICVRSEGAPVLFRQLRVGRHGRSFNVFKFRTMAPDAEARLHRDGLYERYVANGFKLPADEDPRITRIGRFLRRTSLDELPQLINVVRGEMSLVGPRPVLAAELASYGDNVVAYTGIKPGLTGYWQVNGRSDVGFPERGELDAYYYAHRSLRFDLRILARTAVTVALRKGAH